MSSLLEDLKKDNLLNVGLHSLRAVIAREVGLKNLSYTFNDEFKQELSREHEKDNTGTDTVDNRLKYPFGYLVVNDMAPNKERVPFKNIRRHGWNMGTSEATYGTVQKSYLFPVILAVELHYFESSPAEAFLASQALMLFTGASAFSFDVALGKGGIRYNNKIGFLDNVTIPMAEANLPSLPGGIELTLPFVFETHIGFVRDVFSVNSSEPTVTSFSVVTGTGQQTFDMKDT